MSARGDTREKVATWPEYALDRLSEAGYRRGGSRRKVVEMLGRQSCAITALDLDARLDGVGRASVYRALEQLEELGLVQKIDLGGDSSGYEKVDPDGQHHHHLVCTDCGKVVPFEDPALEEVIHDVPRPKGFSVVSHDITLKGTCEDC
jgi:Fur family ferric uptake transcriptional regulator